MILNFSFRFYVAFRIDLIHLVVYFARENLIWTLHDSFQFEQKKFIYSFTFIVFHLYWTTHLLWRTNCNNNKMQRTVTHMLWWCQWNFNITDAIDHKYVEIFIFFINLMNILMNMNEIIIIANTECT